ncbi:MAG TPA: hypothetical protein VFN29_00840 [Chiayiivirga sp.]|nr:hypothetical protein [Chiayiivirga sp.]
MNHPLRTAQAKRWMPALLALLTTPALATNFPVTGSLSIDGSPTTLPAGGNFGDSTYDPLSGALSAGAFTLPASTVSFPTQLGTVVVVYQLSQTNTSTGTVDASSVASLTHAEMALTVVSASLNGFPVSLGTCVFQPIDLYLVGTASASGMDLSDPNFSVPPVAPTACAGYGATINAAIAGSNKSINLILTGDFTPPIGIPIDFLFADGFEIPTPAIAAPPPS